MKGIATVLEAAKAANWLESIGSKANLFVSNGQLCAGTSGC